MLATISFPIADVRGLFAQQIGRVDNHSISAADFGNGQNSRYLRSVGLPSRRRLGPGPGHLSEYSHFEIGRNVAQSNSIGSNRQSAYSVENYFGRYLQLDEISGRVDLGSVYGLGRSKIKILDLFSILHRIRVQVSHPLHPTEHEILAAGDEVASFFQSRTTKESVLRSGGAEKATFAGFPIVFIEGLSGEFTAPSGLMQEVRTDIPDVNLYHGYLPGEHRVWLISRNKPDRETYLAARSLRMVLSRLYTQQSNFRSMVRNLPTLLEAVDDAFLFESYSQFLVQNKRFIYSLCKSVAKQTGHDFGTAARMANDKIRPEEVETIIGAHESIVTRREVLKNLLLDLQIDAAQTNTAASNRNFVIGKANVSQTITLAGPSAKNVKITSVLIELADLFSVYGALVSINDQDAASRILEDMARANNKFDNPGPVIFNLTERLRRLLQKTQAPQSKISDALRKIEGVIST